MKYEFNIEQKDVEDCYRAFFVPKENKWTKTSRWIVFSAFVLSVIAFIWILAAQGDGLWQMAVLMIVLGLVTAGAFFAPKLFVKMSIKHYNKTQLSESDRVEIVIENNKYNEKIYAGKTLLNEHTYRIEEITRLDEDDNNFYVLFNFASISIIKKEGANEEQLKETGIILHKGLNTPKSKANKENTVNKENTKNKENSDIKENNNNKEDKNGLQGNRK